MKQIPVALTSWVVGWAVLLACAGSPERHLLYNTHHWGEDTGPVAGCPRFPRGPGTPSAPKPPRQLTPVQVAMTRWLEPKVARQRFDLGVAEAQRKFPHLEDKPSQEHHVHPKYLGGPPDGPPVKVEPAYHQLITHEFRNERAYGMKPPEPDEQLRIMKAVYSKYPLPGVHF